MTFDDDALNRLAPPLRWEPDWANVLGRAGELGPRRPLRLRARRRLILALAVLAAVLIPLIALGAANQWWFLKFGAAPTPTSTPQVVQDGTWDGHPWELVAYSSTTDGLCFSVTPTSSMTAGEGGAMSCGPFAGVARTNETKATPDMTITFLSAAASDQLPAYIAGPVIDNASEVEIRFTNGQALRLPTFAAPTSFGRVRFYATPLPAGVSPSPPAPGQFSEFVKSVAGLDSDGNVIACLAPATAVDGISPLSACK